MATEEGDEGVREIKGEDKSNKERIIDSERCSGDDANAEKHGKQ